MQRHFKGWEENGAKTDHIWTGITGTTKDEQPHVGPVPGVEGQYVLAGWNGGGMAYLVLAAKGLAEMIEGKQFDETGLPPLFETKTERL